MLSLLRKLVLVGLVLAVFAGTAHARKIVFASDSTWPPLEYVDENKNITGYSIELMKAADKEAGFEAEFKSVAWDGIFAGLDAGKYDAVCSSVEMTPERKETMLFSDPYYEVVQGLVVAKDAPYKSLKDMKGKTVAAQISTTGYNAITKFPDVKAKSYDEIGLAMEDLNNKRIDGVVTDDPVAKYYAMRRPEYANKFKLAALMDEEKGLYGIAVSKDNKDAKEIIELINKGLKAAKAKGIDKQLAVKFMGQ